MGVTGLWSIVQPCARPIKLETLNRKRLAVDASIWIYQFLKAVRDKEGNALRNSHVVGFFRRICKLLFFGIKPVFVFDGGAPILKRQTITGRKARREGRREDAVRTAGKLLAVQMARRAEEDERKRKEERDRRDEAEEEEIPENLVYVDELQMTARERQQNRQFKKKDAYHLPNLDVSLADMGAPNDPRIMSHEELEEYAKQFHRGEDVNIYDFSKIDFNGPFFQSLPASDRYNILNAARLRSRLRMGYSKDQLDTMFPDRMAFSKFQVDRVRERNELTQRLMNINGMNGDDAMFGVNGVGRVAGEKGKEYVLVKNDGVEGGWALGVVSNKGEGERNKPIDVDGLGTQASKEEEDQASEEEGFEDIPIEGLNRLPKRALGASASEYSDGYDPDDIAKRRRALYEARLESAGRKNNTKPKEIARDPSANDGDDSLFMPEEIPEDELDAADDDLFVDVPPEAEEDDSDLRRAIAMSLEKEEGDVVFSNTHSVKSYSGPRIDMPLDFNQKNAQVGRNFAHMTNARAQGAATKPFRDDSDDEESPGLEAALAGSRQTKHVHNKQSMGLGSKPSDDAQIRSRRSATPEAIPREPAQTPKSPPQANLFDGPLPFESLNLGKSILGKKKQKAVDGEAGGFEKGPSDMTEDAPKPLPPWFTGEVQASKVAEQALRNRELETHDSTSPIDPFLGKGPLMQQESGEVIDLDAPQDETQEVIEVDSSNFGSEDEVIMGESKKISKLWMGDVADSIRAEPPDAAANTKEANFGRQTIEATVSARDPSDALLQEPKKPTQDAERLAAVDTSDNEEPIEWDESDDEENQIQRTAGEEPLASDWEKLRSHSASPRASSRSISPEFEDVEVAIQPTKRRSLSPDTQHQPDPAHELSNESIDAIAADQEDMYSDPEDEDLMRQLAIEAEEHARFASTLNAKSVAENAQDYETELRQLRNQQKKDRRDADEVTHIMVTECQQLLKLFGLPYVTAPMEAEAQCAELVSLGLVDGIVTDDSDIFLFGGTRVYKNMFNQAKFVECYLTSDLEKEYSLDRQRLIRVAHLLGSDYTEGLPSVGPVTALEIISEFEDLEAFTEWWNSVQMGQKLPAEDASNALRKKLRKTATKILLPNNFPDKRVDIAYLNPEVDSDPSPFEWGVPDLDALRSFLMATIGWSQERTDEVLVPVVKDMNRREIEGTQANITQFFGGRTGVGAKRNADGGNSGFAPRRRTEGKSKRMESALGKLHHQARRRTIDDADGNRDAAVDTASLEPLSTIMDAADDDVRPKKSRKPNRRKRIAPVGSPSTEDDYDETSEAPKKAFKGGNRAKKGRTNDE
ncbi:MAG: hypothetical protein LQ351_000134 [Letrouitia transgressa]|nr:MAG: hypothetical protein LQ351_000134 [Letrouitia transgressa]